MFKRDGTGGLKRLFKMQRLCTRAECYNGMFPIKKRGLILAFIGCIIPKTMPSCGDLLVCLGGVADFVQGENASVWILW